MEGAVTGPFALVVDDDDANLIVVRAACEGLPLLCASSAALALDAMRAAEVGVVIADQRMPGQSGVDLLARVKEEFPDAVRVLITAYADLKAAIDAINRGHVRRYLKKPWQPEELRAEIREALALYEMSRRIQTLERRLLETERVYVLGVVAASIAHELRTPMASVRMNLTLVERDLLEVRRVLAGSDVADGVRDNLAEIDECLRDASLGVGQVMEIVRGVELPTRRTDDAVVDLCEVVRLTLRVVGRELRTVATVALDIDGPAQVRGSSSKLGQVALNLVVNAIQALGTPPSPASWLSVSIASDAGSASLEVADNGRGLPPESAARVFDPFFTTKGSTGGMGLGLAISKAIVEELGGRIEASSRPEGGARFRVVLPLGSG